MSEYRPLQNPVFHVYKWIEGRVPIGLLHSNRRGVIPESSEPKYT